MLNWASYLGSKDGLCSTPLPETVPSAFTLALKENCLLTVLPSVSCSRTVPWPEADGPGAAADAVRSTVMVEAMAVINNPAKRNILLRFMVVSLRFECSLFVRKEGDQRANDHTHPHFLSLERAQSTRAGSACQCE